jgi:hypothetical protein
MKLFLKWFFGKLKTYAIASAVIIIVCLLFSPEDAHLDLWLLECWVIGIPVLWFMVSIIKFWSRKEEKRHHSEEGTKFWE